LELSEGADAVRWGYSDIFLEEARQLRRIVETEFVGRFGNGQPRSEFALNLADCMATVCGIPAKFINII
jgi:hypothetical protein